jgi:hypothetical protein
MSIKAQTEIINDKDSLDSYISEFEKQEKITNSPLLVIDGFAIDYSDYKKKNQPLLKSEIKQIDYLSKDSEGAINIYGERGKNGVLLIMTYKSQENLQENTSKSLADSKVLFLIGSRQISQEELQKIDPKDIISIDVIKDKDSIKNYTSEDYDGIVIITMKEKNKKKKNN